MHYTKEDAEILSRHVSNLDKQVYVVHNVPPEVVSTLFAYVSRSPESFRDNLLKLIKSGDIKAGAGKVDYFRKASEIASGFHKKWVVGFGHFSVAEHAVLNIAIEDVSILLSKIIEDNRLASYTEKSTRYQVFDRNRYYKPKRIMKSKFANDYEETLNKLFDFYNGYFNEMLDFIKGKNPKPKEMQESFYEMKCKSKACDAMRYTLPAATLTNIGATFNARSLVHAIRKMLSNPLEEAQHIGMLLKEEAGKFLPTIIKAAEKSEYIEKTEHAMRELALRIIEKGSENEKKKEFDVKFVDYDASAEDKLVAAMLYRHLHEPFEKVLVKVKKLSGDKKEKVFEEFFKKLTNKDAPLRELEHAYYKVEILVDFGAYRDLQRHRMCTQTPQLLSTKHGFSIPEEMKEFGIANEFSELMKEAKELYEKLAEEMPYEAQYCVPLAYKKRVLYTLNARELYHIIRLRTGRAGHKSYRRIAQKMYLELKKIHPLLAKYFSADLS
ncbi:MAG: FAD-dependent thymidylate synthase [Candidatus Diapherotrites archaeon]|nr:FAD-dependent thymidylate synthase [Candidatus Diapherotrites archaeon]